MSLLRGLFATALASVHLDMRDCRILLRFLKGGVVSSEEIKTFRCAPNKLPIEAAYYLSKVRKRHPFTYVATISHSLHQGAVEGTGGETGMQRIIIGKKWSVFISKNAISDDLDNFYRATSLDFLYSPFLMLYQSIRSRLDGTKRLYVLLQQATVALFIMDSSRLYFSAIQSLESSTQASSPAGLESALDSTTDSTQNEEIGQLSDLDNVGEQKDFIEANEESQSTLENQKRELEDFARVATATTILKESINAFYNNHSDSDFIAEIVVIDGTSMVQKAAEYLRNNLMIDTQILEVDMCQLIAEIAQHDLLEV